MVSVCLQSDQFSLEQCRWVAVLHTQRDQKYFGTAYQDDYRPGQSEWNSWLRLGKFCEENSLYIHRLQLQYYAHVEVIPPDDADGYFFRHAEMFIGNYRQQYYVVGSLVDGILTVNKWSIPDLIAETAIVRDPLDAGISLIKKHPDVPLIPFDQVSGRKDDFDIVYQRVLENAI